MDAYFEKLKKKNLIFTAHLRDPKQPYISINMNGYDVLTPPEGPSYWSHLSGRYRDAFEQAEYMDRGCVDVALPPKE